MSKAEANLHSRKRRNTHCVKIIVVNQFCVNLSSILCESRANQEVSERTQTFILELSAFSRTYVNECDRATVVISTSTSSCCETSLLYTELFPVYSWIFFPCCPGRCRRCNDALWCIRVRLSRYFLRLRSLFKYLIWSLQMSYWSGPWRWICSAPAIPKPTWFLSNVQERTTTVRMCMCSNTLCRRCFVKPLITVYFLTWKNTSTFFQPTLHCHFFLSRKNTSTIFDFNVCEKCRELRFCRPKFE